MMTPRRWEQYPDEYRAKEMQIIANWVLAGESGSVVGLPGCGRSNLLEFLCHRPEILSKKYLPETADSVALIPVDLNHLPANNSATLYRVLLRAFYWVRERFNPNVKERIARLYLENRATLDPFLSQSALHEMLFTFQAQQTQVVLVLNHFDQFCAEADARLLNTLRGLRDSFRDTLCFVVGMKRSVMYLPEREVLGDMYELLDSNICWVGAMGEKDARHVITQVTRTASVPPNEEELGQMLKLTGHFPVLLKTIGHWWQKTDLLIEQWQSHLEQAHDLEYRIARLWKALSSEEQFALAAVCQWQGLLERGKATKKESERLEKDHAHPLAGLIDKGLCNKKEENWHIHGQLLTAYIRRVGPSGRGRIRVQGKAKELHQGLTRLEKISPQEDKLLRFMIQYPYDRHTYTTLINEVWSEDGAGYGGITNNSLQQLVSNLRRKIEVDSTKPRYILVWRGKPEGGYQFFPEGRPA